MLVEEKNEKVHVEWFLKKVMLLCLEDVELGVTIANAFDLI